MDSETLQQLNQHFIRSVQNSDVRWFEEHLATDFLNSSPDGSLLDRAAFLAHIARPAGISDFQAHDVRIRTFADMAIIHGRTTYSQLEGAAASPAVWRAS